MTPCLAQHNVKQGLVHLIFSLLSGLFQTCSRFHMPEVFPGRFSCPCSFHQEFPSAANRKLLFPGMQKVDFSAPGLECIELTPLLVKAQAIAPLPWGQEHPQLLPNLEQKRSSLQRGEGQRSQGPFGPDYPTSWHP